MPSRKALETLDPIKKFLKDHEKDLFIFEGVYSGQQTHAILDTNT
jgi:hypothetical protein